MRRGKMRVKKYAGLFDFQKDIQLEVPVSLFLCINDQCFVNLFKTHQNFFFCLLYLFLFF